MSLLLHFCFAILFGVIGVAVLQYRSGRREPFGDRMHLVSIRRRLPISEENMLREQERPITGFRIGLERRSGVRFHLSRERSSDRLCKRLGLATELQTGDPTFDDRVYVLCDHPALFALLRTQPEAREAVRRALDEGFDAVASEGRAIWLERSSSGEPTTNDHEVAARVFEALSPIENATHADQDPFVERGIWLQVAIGTIIGYALTNWIDFLFPGEPHLLGNELIVPGIGLGALLLGALVGAVAVFFRGSSRGARVLTDAAPWLLIALPISSLQLAADLNRLVDDSERTITTHARITACDVRPRGESHESKRAYYVLIDERVTAEGVWLPSELRVSRELCEAAKQLPEVRLLLVRGLFGEPRILELSVGAAIQTP